MLRLKKMCLFCKIKGNRLESELFSIGYSMRYKQRFININSNYCDTMFVREGNPISWC